MKVTFIKVEGGHAFEVRSANGRLLATSTAFRRRVDAASALTAMQERLANATVVEREDA